MNCDERRKISEIFYSSDTLMSKLGIKDMVKNLHASFFHSSTASGNIQVQIYHHLNQA